jgi:hypothetical protein
MPPLGSTVSRLASRSLKDGTNERFPERILHASFTVEFATEATEEARKSAVLEWQDRLREQWRGVSVGPLRVIDLTAIVADFSGEKTPLLAAIMQALVDRGWRVDGNTRTMIAPEEMGGEAYSLPDAIAAQTYREIGIGKG